MVKSSTNYSKISLIFTAFLIGVMIGTPLLNGYSFGQTSNMTAVNLSNMTALNNSSYEFQGDYPTNATASTCLRQRRPGPGLRGIPSKTLADIWLSARYLK